MEISFLATIMTYVVVAKERGVTIMNTSDTVVVVVVVVVVVGN